MDSFRIARLPHLYFGAGSFNKVPEILSELNMKKLALITGKSSFRETEYWSSLIDQLDNMGVKYRDFAVSGEPSPDFVDQCSNELRSFQPQVLISIGGGSPIDAGKACSAMIPVSGSITDYLEGVGSKKPSGEKIPFVALPTTAGTGSEATKNAVISKVGENGFKKSLRHDNYIPDYAIIDPRLALSCPSKVSAASGLDAITQLLGAFVSKKANSFTDALAESGLKKAGMAFPRVVEQGKSDLDARTEMAYAAYCSGICLANAGLGLVHGIASPAGAAAEVPHGLVCGSLIFETTRRSVGKLLSNGDSGAPALEKYSRAGLALSGEDKGNVQSNIDLLLERLAYFSEISDLPRLSEYGLTKEMAFHIAEASGLKNHPVSFNAEEISEIIQTSL